MICKEFDKCSFVPFQLNRMKYDPTKIARWFYAEASDDHQETKVNITF